MHYLHSTEFLLAKGLSFRMMYLLFCLVERVCCVKPSSVPLPAGSSSPGVAATH